MGSRMQSSRRVGVMAVHVPSIRSSVCSTVMPVMPSVGLITRFPFSTVMESRGINVFRTTTGKPPKDAPKPVASG